MSNGSITPWDASRQKRASGRNRCFRVLLAGCVALFGGCHHQTFQERSDLRSELAALTAEDLLSLAISHARSGDLLRAEQYLTAARQRGHDESMVVYWQVRVCVAGGRYRSAVGHAVDYLRDHPADWSLQLIVATLHEALGDATRAESELEHITSAAPGMPLAHYRLAMLYRMRPSDQAKANAHLEAYLRLAPDGRHAAEAKAALSETTEFSNGPRLQPFPATTDSTEEVR